MFGMGYGFRNVLLFSSQKSEMNLADPSFLGMMRVRLKNVLRARCTLLGGGAPLGHYIGYQKSTVQGKSTKACIIAPKWVQTMFPIISTTLATIVPILHPFHLSGFFN